MNTMRMSAKIILTGLASTLLFGCAISANELKQDEPVFQNTSQNPPEMIVECVHGKLAGGQIGMATRSISGINVSPVIDKSEAPNLVQLIGRQNNTVLFVLLSTDRGNDTLNQVYKAPLMYQTLDTGQIVSYVISLTTTCSSNDHYHGQK